MTYFVCSGRGPATQVACDFETNDPEEAMSHFEDFDHDVDSLCQTCEPGTYHPDLVSDLR